MPFSILLAMTRLGHEAVIFDYCKYLSKLDGNRMLKKVAYKLDNAFYQSRCKNINSHFIRLVQDFKPKLIIVVKGSHILPETIKKINELGITIVNWHVDDPFNQKYLTAHSAQNLMLYDIHFSSRPHLFTEYIQKGARRVEYLEFCYDETIFYLLDSGDDIKYEISFVGNWSQEREELIKELAQFFKIYVWGGSWWRAHSLKNNKNIYLHNNRANLEEYSRIISHSKVCLNFLTQENRDQTNLRNFELQACMGFQLCNRTDQIRTIFDEDKEICLFSAKQELIEKCRYYINHDDERLMVARKGYERITQNQHTFVSRCQKVLSVIQ